MRASLRQVAEKAGVSHVTVVNILRGRSSRASEQTRERVLEAVRDLNYVPIAQPATQQRHVETKIIGLVFDQSSAQDEVMLATFRGLQDGAREHGYDLLTLCRSEEEWQRDNGLPGGDKSTLAARFLDRRCDGYIFVGPYERPGVLETVTQSGVPVVTCYTADVPDGVAHVQPDDYMAMELAVQHLKMQGHTKIAHLAGPQWHGDARERRIGFQNAMQHFGLHEYSDCIQYGREGKWWPNGGDIEQLLTRDVTAVICVNDGQALDVWRMAQAAGKSVPDDLSLIGMDNLRAASEAGLTTVAFSPVEIGRVAIDALVGLRQNHKPSMCSQRLPVELIQRNSVSAPAAYAVGIAA